MNITQKELAQYFKAGDRVKTGGGTAVFEIVAIDSDCVRIKPDNAKNPARLDFRKLNAVFKHASQIEEDIAGGNGIEKTIRKALKEESLGESQTETYLCGFVRELLKRREHDSISLSLDDYNKDFERRVRKSLTDSPKVRQDRLKDASRTPRRILVTAFVFERNPDVVATVLMRANGSCERCRKPAPFRRQSDNSPYLEVHHKKPLAQGGEDIVDNAIALCPNCHREAHYG